MVLLVKPYEGAIVLLEPNEFKEYQKIARGKLSAKEDRPLCIAVEDPRKKGVFWAVPITKEVGTKLVHAKKAPDKFRFYKFLGKDSCFIISNMFPITDKDIKREYTKGGKPARLAQPDFEKLRDHVRKIVNNPPKWESVMSETNIKELYAYTVKKLELEKTQERTPESAQHGSVTIGKITKVTNDKIFQENAKTGTLTEHRRDAVKGIGQEDIGKSFTVTYGKEDTANVKKIELAQPGKFYNGTVTAVTNDKIFQEKIKTKVEEISRSEELASYPEEKNRLEETQTVTLYAAQPDRIYRGPIIAIQDDLVIQEISPDVAIGHSADKLKDITKQTSEKILLFPTIAMATFR